MSLFLDDGDVRLYHGDCLDVLRELPDRSVHMCATSPPFYGLRDYGVQGQIGLEETPDMWVARLVAVFREVRRVLRDDGTLWVEIGDSYVSGQGGRQSAVGEMPARALSLDSSADVGRGDVDTGSWRSGATSKITPARGTTDLKPKDLLGQPWMLAFALRADGWYLRSEIIWHKVNAMPESVTDRPTKAHSTIFLLSKSPRYYFDSDAIREPHKHDGRTITAVVGREGSIQHRDGERWPGTGANARSVWPLTTEPYSARAHGHGTYYRASADCPKHGLLADREKWLAAARGERSAFEGDYHIGGNDARLALGQELADASTATRTPDDRSAATSRSTQSRRTDRVPATSPSCTPSARTGVHTDGTSAQPESCESAGRTPLSRTEGGGPCALPEQGLLAETRLRTADTCTCEKCSADHFATWPQKLVARMVKAGTSEKGCCPECGASWEREISQEPNLHPGDSGRTSAQGDVQRGKREDGKAIGTIMRERHQAGRHRATLGWQPSCDHGGHQPVPCTILDPFAGSGTTLKVARDHARHAIGIELNEDYCRIAADRLAQQSLLTGDVA